MSYKCYSKLWRQLSPVDEVNVLNGVGKMANHSDCCQIGVGTAQIQQIIKLELEYMTIFYENSACNWQRPHTCSKRHTLEKMRCI